MSFKPIEDTHLWKGTAKTMEWLLFLISAVLASLVFLSVPVRYILNSSIFGVEEVIMMMAIWIYFLGAAYGSYEQSHINADIMLHFIKNEKAVRVITILKHVITIVVFGLFAYWCVTKYFAWTIQDGGMSMQLHIPNWVPISMMTLSFILMVLYQIVHLYRVFKPYKGAGVANVGEEVDAQ